MIVGGAATTFAIHYLHLHERHVGTICHHAVGTLDECELEVVGWTSSIDTVTTACCASSDVAVAHGTNCAWYVGDVLERVQETVFGLCAACHQAVVDQQVNHRVGRNDVDVFLHTLGIVPVTHNMRAAIVDIDPTVPHHLSGIESFLLDAHGIDHA